MEMKNPTLNIHGNLNLLPLKNSNLNSLKISHKPTLNN